MINGKSNSEMGTKSKNVTKKKFKDKIPGILEQNRKKFRAEQGENRGWR